MAAYFLHVTPVFKKIQEDFFIKSAGFVRNASKGIGKANHGGYNYGMKKGEGKSVNKGNILFHDTKLVYVPGLNVGIGGFNKLYSKVPGTVRISCEKTNFKPDVAIVKHSFVAYVPTYKQYMNVIPRPLHKRFKLVEKF